MIVKLPYASEAVAVDLRGMRVRPLAPRAPSDRRDVREMVGNAIDQPVSGASLRDRAKGRTSATIIVPDTTRKLPLREILPVILQNLVGAGIRDSKITILIACGTHPGVGAGETRALIGELPAGISVVEHDSRSANELVTVGELRPGIPLRLNRAAIETDLLITVGAIRHHYFAGFGGGPKMVFPGVAGHDEIQANHSLVLATGDDGSRIRDPRCEPGILDGKSGGRRDRESGRHPSAGHGNLSARGRARHAGVGGSGTVAPKLRCGGCAGAIVV